MNVGNVLKADVFAAGDKVDVAGVSKGKGYQGVIKRYGQHRLRESMAPAPWHGMPALWALFPTPLAFSPASACPATWVLSASLCRT